MAIRSLNKGFLGLGFRLILFFHFNPIRRVRGIYGPPSGSKVHMTPFGSSAQGNSKLRPPLLRKIVKTKSLMKILTISMPTFQNFYTEKESKFSPGRLNPSKRT